MLGLESWCMCYNSNGIFFIDVCALFNDTWCDTWWWYVCDFIHVSGRIGRRRRHSVLHCTSLLHHWSLWRNGQNLAQIGSEERKHVGNVPITWSSYEAVSASLHCCIDSQLIVNTVTGLITTPGSRRIYFSHDIWWKHFSSSTEFDFKLSLAPGGSVPGAHGCVFVCMKGGF